MKKKRVATLLIAGLMSLPFATGVYAQIPDGGIVAPQWLYMSDASVSISFSGTSGTANVTVGRINKVTTKLEGTITVYKQVGNKWEYVASNSDSSTRGLSVSVSFTGESGATYKAVADITAYSSTGNETDTISKQAVCP